MDNFLLESKGLLNTKKKLCFVMGNESCDLDSAIAAICLSYLFKVYPSARNHLGINWDEYEIVLPLMNIAKEDLSIKTEVLYFLTHSNLNREHLICRDEVDENQLKNATFILVDHFVPKINYNIIQIIDHRPIDEKIINEIKTKQPDCIINIEEVGSCCTLIAQAVFKYYQQSKMPLTDTIIKDIYKLLYGPIILDTVNFEPGVDRARKLDCQMKMLIEFVSEINETYRYLIFQELVRERKNIAGLTAYQLSSKDLKIINGSVDVLGIPGYPILIQDMIKLPNAAEDIKKFAEKKNCDCLLMMGMNINDSSKVQRDIGIINIKNRALFNTIVHAVTTLENPQLQLKAHENCTFLNGKFYHQSNIAVTRKLILSILQKLLK